MMPSSSQSDSPRQHALQVNTAEIRASLLATTRTNSDRPLLGIPNSNDHYGDLPLYPDPATGLPLETFQTHECSVDLERSRPTAPESVVDLSQISTGPNDPRPIAQISEPTLGDAQNHTPTSIQTLPRRSETTFIMPTSSPYPDAVDLERSDLLTDMKIEEHATSDRWSHDFGSTLDPRHLTEQQRVGYPVILASPLHVSDFGHLELQMMPESQGAQRSRDTSVDDASTQSPREITRTPYLKTPKRKREDSSPDCRDGVVKTSRLDTCIRCGYLHEKCEDGDPCLSCRDIRKMAIVWNLDRFRASVDEVQVYRTAAISFPDGLPKIAKWVDKSNHVVRLYNCSLANTPLKPFKCPILAIECCQYVDDLPEDYLKKRWISNGDRKEIVLPKYAIRNIQRTRVSEKLDATFNTNYTRLVRELSFKQDEFVATTLTAAAHFAQNGAKSENRDMMDSALRIAIITRLASKSFNITGSNCLGIPQDTDPTSPYHRRVPIPPILDFQIDCEWMHKMDKLRKVVVSHLNKLTIKQERKNWYPIFLTIMILLSNLEFLYQHQHWQMLSYRGPAYNPIQMMESWRHSAKVLITYFHDISHGNLPIIMRWTKEDDEAAGLDEQARTYLAKLKAAVKSHEELLRERAKGQPHTPLVWVSALLFRNDGIGAPLRARETADVVG